MGQRLAVLPAILVLSCIPRPIPAQGLPEVTPGDRVRVSAREGQFFLRLYSAGLERSGGLTTRVTGTVLARVGEEFRVENPDRGEVWLIPTEAIRKIEISAGKGSRPGKGALFGLIGGFVLGGIQCMAVCGSHELETPGSKFFWGGLRGGFLGAPLGLVVGFAFSFERWTEVAPSGG